MFLLYFCNYSLCQQRFCNPCSRERSECCLQYWCRFFTDHFRAASLCGFLDTVYINWTYALCFCVCVAVRSRRTRTPAALQRVWLSRSASVSSLRGRRFPTRSKLHANSWSWRTSSTPSSKPDPFHLPAPPYRRHQCSYAKVLREGRENNGSREQALASLTLTVSSCLCCFPPFFFF